MPQTSAVLALSIFAGAQISEIVRGGIGSLPPGQLEAGKAMGLTSLQRFRLLVLPLALPRMMPPWANTVVEILKGTALASLIGVTEFLYQSQAAVGTTFEPIPFYIFAAASTSSAASASRSLPRSSSGATATSSTRKGVR